MKVQIWSIPLLKYLAGSLQFGIFRMLYWVKVMVFIAAFAVVIFLLHLLLLIRYGFLPKNRNNFVIVMLVLGYLWMFLLKLILSFMRKVFCKINCTVLKLTCVCAMQGHSSGLNPPITSDFEVLWSFHDIMDANSSPLFNFFRDTTYKGHLHLLLHLFSFVKFSFSANFE